LSEIKEQEDRLAQQRQALESEREAWMQRNKSTSKLIMPSPNASTSLGSPSSPQLIGGLPTASASSSRLISAQPIPSRNDPDAAVMAPLSSSYTAALSVLGYRAMSDVHASIIHEFTSSRAPNYISPFGTEASEDGESSAVDSQNAGDPFAQFQDEHVDYDGHESDHEDDDFWGLQYASAGADLREALNAAEAVG